jgi:hypothetical protein
MREHDIGSASGKQTNRNLLDVMELCFKLEFEVHLLGSPTKVDSRIVCNFSTQRGFDILRPFMEHPYETLSQESRTKAHS